MILAIVISFLAGASLMYFLCVRQFDQIFESHQKLIIQDYRQDFSSTVRVILRISKDYESCWNDLYAYANGEDIAGKNINDVPWIVRHRKGEFLPHPEQANGCSRKTLSIVDTEQVFRVDGNAPVRSHGGSETFTCAKLTKTK